MRVAILPRVLTRASRLLAAVGCVIVAGTTASCDKVARVVPTDAVITISTNRTVLALNGTA